MASYHPDFIFPTLVTSHFKYLLLDFSTDFRALHDRAPSLSSITELLRSSLMMPPRPPSSGPHLWKARPLTLSIIESTEVLKEELKMFFLFRPAFY